MKRTLLIGLVVLAALVAMCVMGGQDNTLDYQKAINSGGLTEVK